MFVVIIGMYFLGYLHGYDKCERMAQDMLMEAIRDYIEEMKEKVGRVGDAD